MNHGWARPVMVAPLTLPAIGLGTGESLGRWDIRGSLDEIPSERFSSLKVSEATGKSLTVSTPLAFCLRYSQVKTCCLDCSASDPEGDIISTQKVAEKKDSKSLGSPWHGWITETPQKPLQTSLYVIYGLSHFYSVTCSQMYPYW